MSDLQVQLFGRFSIRCGDIELEIEARKTQELLAYLLLHREQPHAREALAEQLWGERAGTQARKYLRQALWQLQTALDARCAPDGARVLIVDADWVQVDPGASLAVDVAQFEAAFLAAKGIMGGELDDTAIGSISAAVQSYRGDLLEGCYQDWCIFERERLQNMYLAMLDKLMDWCAVHQEYEAGLGYGGQILRHDRARERTHQRMMRLYYLEGDRSAALRQYNQLVRALHEELNVKPSRRSVMIWEQIRAETLDDGPPEGPGTGNRALADTARSGTLGLDPRLHLRQVHAVLCAMQRQLRQEIEAIELALDA
jgi:DNA-binding SARP family transcriptional activator